MEYIQLNEDMAYLKDIPTYINTEWDATHFCPPQSLTPSEAELFRVFQLHPSPLPVFDQFTEKCVRDGAELIDGVWVYKWKVEAKEIIVPSEVTQRQAKEELIDIDLIDTIEAFLDAIPDPKQKRIGLNWYNNSQTFMRNNQFLNYVWTYLGKSQEELDTLFINASKR